MNALSDCFILVLGPQKPGPLFLTDEGTRTPALFNGHSYPTVSTRKGVVLAFTSAAAGQSDETLETIIGGWQPHFFIWIRRTMLSNDEIDFVKRLTRRCFS